MGSGSGQSHDSTGRNLLAGEGALTSHERDQYQNAGFFLRSDRFDPAECASLIGQWQGAPLNFDGDDEIGLVEEDDAARTTRSVYGLHKVVAGFQEVLSDPRLLAPTEALLGSEVYAHSSQLNPKAAFVGQHWTWHQDYMYWARDDAMPTSAAVNVVLYLSPMEPFNGPLLLIPGSHLETYDQETVTVADGWEATLGSELRHEISKEAIRDAADRHGIAVPLGPSGSVLFFDPRLLHASSSNVSPYMRTSYFIRYNSINNTPDYDRAIRPQFLNERDPQPIRRPERSGP